MTKLAGRSVGLQGRAYGTVGFGEGGGVPYICIYMVPPPYAHTFPLRCHGRVQRLRISKPPKAASTKALYCANVLGPKMQNRCAVPKKPILLRENKQKCCAVPKERKKPKFRDLQALGGAQGLQTLFFGFFGTVQHFRTFCLKKIGFLGQYSTFEAWDCKNAVLSQKNQGLKAANLP